MSTPKMFLDDEDFSFTKINRLCEGDFDKIIEKAGGRRFSEDDTKEQEYNADYVFEESVIELKLLEEEGLEKEARQKRIAELFQENQPNRPVAVVHPDLLTTEEKKRYYRIIEGPIKSQIRKAAKQLANTKKQLGDDQKICVAILINNGYTALYHDEFKRIAVKLAKNNTKKIDIIIIGGMYYYSDSFDSYFICPFECVKIREREFSSFEMLRDSWNKQITELMTTFVRDTSRRRDAKLPVIDIQYDHEGVTFVKPSPQIGKRSGFFPGDRPRKNTTGITKCPPVGICIPKFTFDEWKKFKNAYPYMVELKEKYDMYCSFIRGKMENGDKLQPFVPIDISYKKWRRSRFKKKTPSFTSLSEYTVAIFHSRIRKIRERSFSLQDITLLVPEYIFLQVVEIGQDEANDMSSIYYISKRQGFEKEEAIIENVRIPFIHAIVLASSYAIQRGVELVLYDKDRTFGWH